MRDAVRVARALRDVIKGDKYARFEYRPTMNGVANLIVSSRSPTLIQRIIDLYDLQPVSRSKNRVPENGNPKKFVAEHVAVFRLDDDGRPYGLQEAKPYMVGDDEALIRRQFVKEQEDSAAEIVGGKRHVGSGAIPGLKGDASSAHYHVEAKQTSKASISVTTAWLDKLSKEARVVDKVPVLHVRFVDIPEHVVIGEDWIMVPATEFARLVNVG